MNNWGTYLSIGAVVLVVLHARGLRLPLVSDLLDRIIPKPLSPVVPSAGAGVPLPAPAPPPLEALDGSIVVIREYEPPPPPKDDLLTFVDGRPVVVRAPRKG